ncbi:methyltransferase domain-containing protein [Caballeronia sp. INSB1]|uniref:class I SAM-dependent methyltransferase n=1 Tax=Caballeronia sp. INSB1 TaxID=2921751 RepID=UPI002033190E|nr:methyltransferase domain-containing protein [Caballeronia sp. INSB1]
MERRDAVLEGLTKDQRGIEIGPWFNPLASKAEGYQCLVLDVFDLATLRQRATEIANVADNIRDRIEDVDLLGSSANIEELVAARGELGEFDYIVSSHNFEHLPNPIKFLQGCAKALKPGGIISMAIPDKRSCFDYFRPLTSLGQWIDAYEAQRDKPTRAQYFDLYSCLAAFDTGNGASIAFHRGVPPDKVSSSLSLDRYYAEWQEQSRSGSEQYLDTHCSVFTPASFELLIRDLGYLGLAPFEIVRVFDSPGVEFYARLKRSDSPSSLRPPDYEDTRNTLLRRILDESSEASNTRLEATELRNQNTRLKDELSALHREIEALKREAALRDHELSAVRTSTSWRITSPLRRAVTILRK